MKQKPITVSSEPSSRALCTLADGLLFLLLLGGMLFSICSAYAIDVDSLKLLGISAGLTVLMLLLYGVRRHRGLWLLAFACLYAFIAWRQRDVLVTGACMAVDQALSTLEIPLQMDTTWLGGTREDVLWFLAMAAALLSLPLGWAVIRGRSGALTVLLTAPWIFPALLLETYPDWLALMALAAGWCVLFISGRSGREDPSGGARMALICFPAVAAMLLLLSVALPREDYVRPAWADSAREQLASTAAEWSESSASNVVGQALSLLSGGDQVSVSLENAGPRSFQNRVVLEVESEYTGRVYLRGTSSAIYTGTEWEPLSDTVYASIGLSEDTIYDPLRGYEPLNFPSLTANSVTPYYEMTISYPSSLSGWMYTPYQLVTTPDEISDVTFEDDSHLERRFGIREKNLYFMPDVLPASVISPYENWVAAQAEAVYRQFVYEHYLDVPEGFEAILTEWLARVDTLMQEQFGMTLSELNGDGVMPLWSPTTVAGLLALSTEYDLDTPYTPEGEDFVDYFLNESHRGYCVHYATAGTLILRAFGVPTRYVTGYTVEIPASGTAEVLDSDAHAWVEMYVDGYGWYPVEMTPASGTGIDSIAPMVQAPNTEPEVEEPEPDEEETPVENPETEEPTTQPNQPEQDTQSDNSTEDRQQGTQQEEQSEAQNGRGWLYLVIPAVCVVAAVPLRRSICRALRRRRYEAADTNRAVIAVYCDLQRLRPFGADPETVLGELARKAKFSQHRLSEEERTEALSKAADERKRVYDALPALRRWWFQWILAL